MKREPRNLADIARVRHELHAAIRAFFFARGYLETETPALYPGHDPNAHLAEFFTRYVQGRVEIPLTLITSPEVHMKRLLAAGLPRIFQLCRFFRNGESTARHNPEFTGLEWYHAGHTYLDLMAVTEELVSHAARELNGEPVIEREGRRIDLSPPWERLTVVEAMRRYAGVELPLDHGREALMDQLRARGENFSPDDGYDDLFFRLYLVHVEPRLGWDKPVFLMDYPAPMAAMARLKPEAPGFAERVEPFVAGLELGNGFTELSDPAEQARRILEVRPEQTSGDLDRLFLAALDQMPPCAGMALGVDRLAMLLTGAASIDEVLLFPFAGECRLRGLIPGQDG
ncbi:MAG: Lysine--tRNA ligase [Myxococcota bacterium]|nr:Lysine--tRNA ligase [Myxococcota bacterium]